MVKFNSEELEMLMRFFYILNDSRYYDVLPSVHWEGFFLKKLNSAIFIIFYQ